MKKSESLHIRIDPETSALINSLCCRYDINKTELVRQALKYFASTRIKGHHYSIYLNEIDKFEEYKQKEKLKSNEKIIDIIENELPF